MSGVFLRFFIQDSLIFFFSVVTIAVTRYLTAVIRERGIFEVFFTQDSFFFFSVVTIAVTRFLTTGIREFGIFEV